MPAPQPEKSPLALVVVVLAIVGAGAAGFMFPHLFAPLSLVVAVAGGAALYALSPRAKGALRQISPAELAPLNKNVAESRNEVIKAMAILQEEIRLLQDAKVNDRETRAMREELTRLTAELAALKASVVIKAATAPAAAPAPAPAAKEAPAKKKPVKEEDDDFDVAPLSFDDDLDEEKPVAKPAAKAAAPVAKAPEPRKPEPVKAAPVFAPEPEPVLESGLEPEDMEDDGDWLTGGLEEEDLVVTKKVDFEDIVKKDAARPKPKVDPEEQRALREEMEQLADENDWVGGGLQDRDVKVKKTTVNDALFDKLRAEIEAKRQAKESATGVRAPARGETALLVNVTVAHGTKLFIRGVGPGLDVEKGAPMHQSGHGKWQWICPEPGKPCVVTVWENDNLQAEGNPIRVPGGFALTVTPTFRRKLKL